MLMYALIGLCLVLLGIAGLQFTYLFYIERIYKQRRAYLQQLEHKCSELTRRLDHAERRLAEQDDLLGKFYQEEAWADVIEER